MNNKTTINAYICNFIRTIKENFPNEYLNLFYKNLYSLDIKNKNILLSLLDSLDKTDGEYDMYKNEIRLNTLCRIKNSKTLYHELFHVASTNIESNISGLMFMNTKECLGCALNEGYTELLTCRYFKKEDGYTYYPNEQIIVKLLEQIMGKEIMSKSYFNANPYLLIKELEHMGIDKVYIINFFSNTNTMSDYQYVNIYHKDDLIIYYRLLIDIFNFLLCIANRKRNIKPSIIIYLNTQISLYKNYINDLATKKIKCYNHYESRGNNESRRN